jgi:hypothetical protein
LRHLSARLRDDEELARKVVTKDKRMFEHVSDRLKNDEEFRRLAPEDMEALHRQYCFVKSLKHAKKTKAPFFVYGGKTYTRRIKRAGNNDLVYYKADESEERAIWTFLRTGACSNTFRTD